MPDPRYVTEECALIERIQAESVRNFADVMDDYVNLMWCLDRYRVADAPPAGMGDLDKRYRSRMDGIYRGKGNWFAILLALLLDNRSGQKIRSRSKIKGYSQVHQIDLAWPDRNVAPIACAESKVTGGPAYREYPQRGAMADWTNRRPPPRRLPRRPSSPTPASALPRYQPFTSPTEESAAHYLSGS